MTTTTTITFECTPIYQLNWAPQVGLVYLLPSSSSFPASATKQPQNNQNQSKTIKSVFYFTARFSAILRKKYFGWRWKQKYELKNFLEKTFKWTERETNKNKEYLVARWSRCSSSSSRNTFSSSLESAEAKKCSNRRFQRQGSTKIGAELEKDFFYLWKNSDAYFAFFPSRSKVQLQLMPIILFLQDRRTSTNLSAVEPSVKTQNLSSHWRQGAQPIP